MNKEMVCGYHTGEFQKMFAITLPELQGDLLEYGCGVNAVNAELTASGRGHLTSCDPLFNLDKETLYRETLENFSVMVNHLKREKSPFNFNDYGSFNAFVENHHQGMMEFFADYEKGKSEKRYLAIKHHKLPFADFTFDLALSTHFLFQDSVSQDLSDHLEKIVELARVAKEVRLFPLIDQQGESSPLLGPVLLGLQQAGYGVEVREVSYYLQPRANAMLRIWAQQCQVNK